MRWIRLDLSWSHSQWLSIMSAESRLAWVELLCYVKGFGTAGRARAMTPDRFARMIYVGEESVRQMLNAAEIHGALTVVENDWVIVKWAKYQGDETGAERQRRFKENRKASSGNAGNALVTEVTATETVTETYNCSSKEELSASTDEKPKKGKDTILEDAVQQVVDHLNAMTGRKFTVRSAANLRARIRESGDVPGAVLVCKLIVDHKCAAWGSDDKMREYLTTDTLFKPTHFEKYSQAAIQWNNNGRQVVMRGAPAPSRDLRSTFDRLLGETP